MEQTMLINQNNLIEQLRKQMNIKQSKHNELLEKIKLIQSKQDELCKEIEREETKKNELLKKGVEQTRQNKLFKAIKNDKALNIELYLTKENSNKIYTFERENPATPLRFAIQYAKINALKALLEHDYVEIKNEDIFDAVHRGYECFKNLIACKRVDINAQNSDQLSIIQEAARGGNSHIVELLKKQENILIPNYLYGY
jgi:hypothetical protein